jgi:hypothetical protein
MPLTRTPLGANSVAMERTRFLRPARAAEVATMCGSGWEASSEFTQTMADLRALELRQKGARGMQHREELQVQLLGPGFVAGVLEGRDTALTGVVDENGSRAQSRFAGAANCCTCSASSTSQAWANRRSRPRGGAPAAA